MGAARELRHGALPDRDDAVTAAAPPAPPRPLSPTCALPYPGRGAPAPGPEDPPPHAAQNTSPAMTILSARLMVRIGWIGPLYARLGVSDRAARAGKGVCKGFAPGLGAPRAPRRWDVGAAVGLIGLARGLERGHWPPKNALRAPHALFGAMCGGCEPSPGWWLAPAAPRSMDCYGDRVGHVRLRAGDPVLHMR